MEFRKNCLLKTNTTVSFLFLFFVGILLSCESKVSEKKVAGYQSETSFERLASTQLAVDARIEEIQNKVTEVSNFIQLTQNVLNLKHLETNPTLKLIDTMNEFTQNKLLYLRGNDFFINGLFYQNSFFNDNSQQRFDFQITGPATPAINEINYYLNNGLFENFLLIAKIKFEKKGMNLTFENDHILKIFPNQKIHYQNGVCIFSLSRSTESSCQNILIEQTDENIWLADFYDNEHPKVIIKGISKKDQKIIFEGQVKFSNDGHVEDKSVQEK